MGNVGAIDLWPQDGEWDDSWDSVVEPCSVCGERWQAHYEPELLKYKLGPFGAFGLKDEGHAPHIPGVHAPRELSNGR